MNCGRHITQLLQQFVGQLTGPSQFSGSTQDRTALVQFNYGTVATTTVGSRISSDRKTGNL